jgi:hypothetical protein
VRKPAEQRSPYELKLDDGYLSDPRIAQRYTVSLRTVKRWRKEQRLPPPDMTIAGRHFTKLSKLESWERKPAQRFQPSNRPPGP